MKNLKERLIKDDFALLYALGAFFVPFIVYMFTVCPVVYWYDSGEYVTTACTFGISHPSGYPTYNVLGFLFTRPFTLFTDNLAYVMNFLSVVENSFTCLFVFMILRLLIKKPFYSFMGALTLAFAYKFWYQAVFTEVYALNVFFIALCTLLIVKWSKTGKNKYLYWFAYLFGLGSGNHVTIVTTAPAFIVFILVHKWDIILKWEDGWKTIVNMGIFFFLGISIYAYLFISSYVDVGYYWVKIETFRDFIWLASAKNYNATGCKVESFAKYLDFFIRGFRIIYDQFGMIGRIVTFPKGTLNAFRDVSFYLGTVLVSLGVVSMFWNLFTQYTKYILLFLLIVFGYLFFYGSYEPFDDFIVPCYFVFAIFLGFGYRDLLEMIRESLTNAPKEISKIVMGLLKVLLVIIPILFLMMEEPRQGKAKCDKSGDRSAADYAESMLDSVPPNSLILFGGDSMTPIMYYQFVVNYRPDVKVKHIFLHLLRKYGIREASELIEKLKEDYPEYKSGEKKVTNHFVSYAMKELIEPHWDTGPVFVVNFDPSTDYSFVRQWVEHNIIHERLQKPRWRHPSKEWDQPDFLSEYNLKPYGNISKLVKEKLDSHLFIDEEPQPVNKLNLKVNDEFVILGYDIGFNYESDEPWNWKDMDKPADMIELPKGEIMKITFYYKTLKDINFFDKEKFNRTQNRDFAKKFWGLYRLKADLSKDPDATEEQKKNPPLIIQEQRPLWYGINKELIPENSYLKESIYFYIKSDRVKFDKYYHFGVAHMDMTTANVESKIGDTFEGGKLTKEGLLIKQEGYTYDETVDKKNDELIRIKIVDYVD